MLKKIMLKKITPKKRAYQNTGGNPMRFNAALKSMKFNNNGYDSIYKPLHHKLFSKVSFAMLAATLSLTGCKSDLNAVIDKVTKKDNVADDKFCQSSSVPFVHSLCEVSQTRLLDPDSPLSLRLFWKSGKENAEQDALADSSNIIVDKQKSRKPLYTFDALLNDLPKNSKLKFAANAGMYDSEFAPIGYTVMQGEQILSLNLKNGAGNFHLTPNGVLWWDKSNHVAITESHKFGQMLEEGSAKPWYASQSGPMLVIDGNIHPKFNASSTSLKIRNGVGVCDDNKIKFVTSSEPVNFYQFAHYFKDNLHCPNALFLDGGIASALYAPDIHYKDDKNMGVMVGVIEKTKSEHQ